MVELRFESRQSVLLTMGTLMVQVIQVIHILCDPLRRSHVLAREVQEVFLEELECEPETITMCPQCALCCSYYT